MNRSIDDTVLAVLSAGRCDGAKFFLPPTQLDRKLYDATNKVLTALGGKWNRSAKAHVFAEPCADRIEGAIESGEYTRPADMGWFPTPRALACRVVQMADLWSGMVALEPSAGEGAIAEQMLKLTSEVYAVEIDPERQRRLDAIPGLRVFRGDFMDYSPGIQFDRVVMNPPFAKRADILHTLRAYSMLNPGGKLVAIMSGGVEFREDALARDFRARCTTIERLPDESFKTSGTSVRTVVVTMDKPA